MQNYYEKELQPIIDEKSEYPIQVKFFGDTHQAKHMSLNLESIESIQAFLEIVKEDLLKKDLKNY